jgi:hypothetical protein
VRNYFAATWYTAEVLRIFFDGRGGMVVDDGRTEKDGKCDGIEWWWMRGFIR